MNKMKNDDLPRAITNHPFKRATSWILVSGLLLTVFLEFHHYTAVHKRSPDDGQGYLFVAAARGIRRQVELPDGTKVWLNASSLLKYPPNMADGERTVELTGEAFFDVEKNAAHPFRVKARDMCVEVLGTRFNLRNYPEDIFSRTAVADGSVKVLYGDADAVLHAGDQADVNVSSLYTPGIKVKKGLDTAMASRWTKGLLEFNNSDFPTVLQELSRAYNIDIQYEGATPSNKFFGSFSVDEPLEEIISRLDFHGLHTSIQKRGHQKLVISIRPGF